MRGCWLWWLGCCGVKLMSGWVLERARVMSGWVWMVSSSKAERSGMMAGLVQDERGGAVGGGERRKRRRGRGRTAVLGARVGSRREVAACLGREQALS